MRNKPERSVPFRDAKTRNAPITDHRNLRNVIKFAHARAPRRYTVSVAAEGSDTRNIAYEISKFLEISRFHSRFQDFTRDFKISLEISRFHSRFQDFTEISRFHSRFQDFTEISRFHTRFQDFRQDFQKDVRDFSSVGPLGCGRVQFTRCTLALSIYRLDAMNNFI